MFMVKLFVVKENDFMKVKVMGTGCTWFKRNNTSFIIDDKIVFDVPSGTYKLINNYMQVKDIDSVIISHFHSDHFADFFIIATLFMRQYHKNRKENLKVYAPKGIVEKLVSFNTLLGGGEDECDPAQLTEHIDFIEIYDGFEFEQNGYKITSYRMQHGLVESYGYTFEDKDGKVFAFPSDTRVCDNLHKMLSKTNVAFLEMSSPVPHKGHISIENFLELQQQYSNTKFYPVHTSDECQEYAETHGMNAVHDGDVFEF